MPYRCEIILRFLLAITIIVLANIGYGQESDSLKLKLTEESNDPFQPANQSNLNLKDPSNINSEVIYNPETNQYEIKQTIGEDGAIKYRPDASMNIDDYIKYDMEKSLNNYWDQKAKDQGMSQRSGNKPELDIKNETVDRIFGGSEVDIRPNGQAQLTFGIQRNKNENPVIPEQNRKTTNFDFDMKIQLNVVGKIGEKLKLTTNYNTEATFDWQNQMKLEYTGFEDEIIKKIEAGNVSMPLKSSLITGSQSLFGIKTEMQFGKLYVTSILSQQKGNKTEIEVQGGAQITEYEVKADRYEENKHFFLSHYFRDHYEEWLENPTAITSPVNITRIEVWVTNTNTATDDTRNVIGFQDLGEENELHFYNTIGTQATLGAPPFPDNAANNLYVDLANNAEIRSFINSTGALTTDFNMIGKRDYQKVELARKLSPDEFTFHSQLGYVSLRQEVNTNQAVAVAFEYTYRGEVFQVGEFSNEIQGQDALILKMLKSTERNVKIPMWDLMMKNIYSIGAYNVQRDGFELDIWYLNSKTGIENNYITVPGLDSETENFQLIRLLNLDSLDINQNKRPDGVFDYIEGVTIIANNGRIIFPVLEPFGSYLRSLFTNQADADKYAFDSLYTTTKANAQAKFPDKNRFSIKGKTKGSAGSNISLGAMNVSEGSVLVTHGGTVLTEGTDYQVDYQIGRVTIINQSILESGTPIKISLESQDLFGIQTKTLMGSRFDYTLSDDIMLGGTVMRLSEKPLTQKVNYGDEPMANTIIGVDGSYKKESQFLTTMIDKLPLIETKEKSLITVDAEAAKLIPGHSNALADEGTSYVDDFEGSQTSIDLKGGAITQWVLASTPQGQPDLFREGNLVNDVAINYNRARLAWYNIDPLFYNLGNSRNTIPEHIKNDVAMRSNHFMRVVWQNEVFPNKSNNQLQPQNLALFDLAYYPSERGQYNYDVDGFSVDSIQYGYGMDENGMLNNPEQRWGGVMRKLETNDFDAANVEFIQFWLMDPFAEAGTEGFPDATTDGELYFNIGEISEDVLRDGRKSFEQGLPTTESEAQNLSNEDNFTAFGRIPPLGTQAIVHSFDNENNSREYQDVGMEGLRDEEERIFFKSFIDKVKNRFTESSAAYQQVVDDPSADNYNYYRDDNYDANQLDILERYKKYNGLDGNSPTSEQSNALNEDQYPTSQSTRPNEEDINLDNTLDDVESYFQYKVKINANDISPQNVGNNYITSVLETNADTEDGSKPIKWYQFKIPIQDYEKAVGGIADFRSIRFMRIYMKGFEKPVFLRFAQLELIRGEWRRYTENLDTPGAYLPVDETSEFNIGAVNIEENSSKTPVNYVLPPGLSREINLTAGNIQYMNEQSMSLEVCDLKDGEARAAYKTINLDVRYYQKIKMYVHAEDRNESGLMDDDLKLFIRLGADFNNNYYEYEIPLKVTQPGFYNSSGDSEEDLKIVWPVANNIEILFEDLFDLKIQRNRAILDNPDGASVNTRYSKNYGAGTILSILGNPNLSTVKTIMIGVKNPKDEGGSKCAEIWVNELRLTDFDERGGYAAIGRINAKLADFANVAVTGSISTPGFGTLENKVNERQKEQVETFDASTTVQLGKLLPDDFGLRLPMYAGYSVNRVTPQFAPQADDVPTQIFENFMKDAGYNIDSIQQVSRDVTKRKSLNFTNIRKEKSKSNADKKTRFYDISNWTGTYAYSEQEHHNFDLENDRLINHRGGLTYSFNANPKAIEPLKSSKVFKSKYFKIIKDFNFYMMPKQIGFRTDVNRMYNERKMRNNVPGTLPLETFVNKNFMFNRNYNLVYDLSKALKLTFDATNNSLIREGEGVIDNEDIFGYLWTDTIRKQVFNYQNMTTTNYRHNTSLNYTLPLNKIPLTDWISSSVRYSSSYTWQRASFAIENWGNTIQNSQDVNFNNTLNMLSLYNKVPYLKKVNQKFRQNKRKKPVKRTSGKGKDDDKKDDKNKITIPDRFAKLLMSTKNVSANYSITSGILLPGYNRETMLLGMDNNFGGPGPGFLFGQQNNWENNDTLSFAQYAQRQNWLVKDSTLNKQYTETLNERFSINVTLEPLNDMRIQLKTNYQYATQEAEFYRYQGEYFGDGNQWRSESPVETGNFSATLITWKTAFGETSDDLFNSFLENRKVISTRLSEINTYSSGNHLVDSGYKSGYGSVSPEVMIPAFMAAYTGTNAESVTLDPFNAGIKGIKQLPLPNWQIKYTGLSKIEQLKDVFKSVTLNHQYQSTYSIGNFISNIDYTQDYNNEGTEIPVLIDPLSSNFVPKYQINSITIQEKFSPLINIDMTWKNSLITRFEIKKDRTLSFGLTNAQLTEIASQAYVVVIGYTLQQVKLPFELRPGTPVQSDLRLTADFSYRKTETTIRKVVENFKQVSAGQRNLSVKITADYKLSDKLNMRAFYDFNRNNPIISTTFPTSNANFGVTLMFTLAP